MDDRRTFPKEPDPTAPRCEKCGGETRLSTFRVSTPGVDAKSVLTCKVCGFRHATEDAT